MAPYSKSLKSVAILGPFLANLLPTYYMTIFHKTQVQRVILKYLTALNLNWLKSYAKKFKYILLFPKRADLTKIGQKIENSFSKYSTKEIKNKKSKYFL